MGHVRRKKLEGHVAMQAGVFRLINDTHANAAELFDNAVVGDRATD